MSRRHAEAAPDVVSAAITAMVPFLGALSVNQACNASKAINDPYADDDDDTLLDEVEDIGVKDPRSGLERGWLDGGEPMYYDNGTPANHLDGTSGDGIDQVLQMEIWVRRFEEVCGDWARYYPPNPTSYTANFPAMGDPSYTIRYTSFNPDTEGMIRNAGGADSMVRTDAHYMQMAKPQDYASLLAMAAAVFKTMKTKWEWAVSKKQIDLQDAIAAHNRRQTATAQKRVKDVTRKIATAQRAATDWSFLYLYASQSHPNNWDMELFYTTFARATIGGSDDPSEESALEPPQWWIPWVKIEPVSGKLLEKIQDDTRTLKKGKWGPPSGAPGYNQDYTSATTTDYYGPQYQDWPDAPCAEGYRLYKARNVKQAWAICLGLVNSPTTYDKRVESAKKRMKGREMREEDADDMDLGELNAAMGD